MYALLVVVHGVVEVVDVVRRMLRRQGDLSLSDWCVICVLIGSHHTT